MEVISEQLVTDAEAKAILEAKEKEGELKYAQKNAVEIIRNFNGRPLEKIKNLISELRKIEKLRDRHIVAIANFLPMDRDDLRTVLHKEYTVFTEDEINIILDTVKRFA